MKEFLGELGPQVKGMIDTLNPEIKETEDGVILNFNVENHPLSQSLVHSSKKNIEILQKFSVGSNIVIGTDFSLQNYNQTLGEMS